VELSPSHSKIRKDLISVPDCIYTAGVKHMIGCVVKKHRFFRQEYIKIIIMRGKTNISCDNEAIEREHCWRFLLLLVINSAFNSMNIYVLVWQDHQKPGGSLPVR
jgi:hypothetical protein